jgi:hypothetical protein
MTQEEPPVEATEKKRMPNAIATITTNAPKSGSSRSSAAVATITANSGRKPRMSVCFRGCCAWRNAALRTA